jgi:signal peptidase II
VGKFNPYYKIRWFFTPLILLTFDQIVKKLSLAYVPIMNQESFPYGGIVLAQFYGFKGALVLAFNQGAAWSLLSEYPHILVILRPVLIAYLVFLWIKFASKSHSWLLGMIWAGALSNWLDSINYGYVVDMVSLTFWNYHYPIFNVADMLICLGACGLAFKNFTSKVEGDVPI